MEPWASSTQKSSLKIRILLAFQFIDRRGDSFGTKGFNPGLESVSSYSTRNQVSESIWLPSQNPIDWL